MTPLSPPLLIAAATALVGAGVESDSSRGRLLDRMLGRVGQPNPDWWKARRRSAGFRRGR